MAQAAKEADLFSVDEVPEDLSGYEVVLAGYWLRRGGPDPKMARFLPRVAGRQVVFFQTHDEGSGIFKDLLSNLLVWCGLCQADGKRRPGIFSRW